jgi:AcrR family transcriptional regulator
VAPRAYNSETRRQQQLRLRARIAAAAAQLHAERGVFGTSYADIARRAGVSLPTVYSHFRTQDELIAACTGHVQALAPELPLAEILGAPDLAAAAARLVDGVERMHIHFEPWLSWGERRTVPTLQSRQDGERKQLTGVIARLLAAHVEDGRRRRVAVVWESLLSFDFWHRLVREHGLTRAAAREALVHLLLAAAGRPRAAATARRPAAKT